MEAVIAVPEVPLPTAPDDELESPTRQLTGVAHRLGTILAIGLSLYALYWVVGIVQPLVYRASFLCDRARYSASCTTRLPSSERGRTAYRCSTGC